MRAGLVPSEAVRENLSAPLSQLLVAVLAFLHPASSLCVCLLVKTSPFYKDTSQVVLGPAL